MNLRQMEVFRSVMMTGGVSGAAELLHVSQPAVSKVLAQAQRQLTFPLFARVKGRLVATPEAHALYAEIDALWRGVDRVRDVSRELSSPRSASLRLAVSASAAPYLVPRTVALLAERYPDLRIRTEILVGPILVDALLDRSADIGVALMPNDHPNLVRVRNYHCGFVCVLPSGHRLARKPSVAAADLVDERVVGSPPDTPYGQALMRAYGRASSSLQVHFHVRSAISACWQVQAGSCIAVVDQAAVFGPTLPGLVIRPFRTRERMPLSLVHNRYRPLSLAHEAFCDEFDRVWRGEMRAD
jgi:DNA-binding transcriptional LysR family regulator